jgi:site-specific DNA recombinase
MIKDDVSQIVIPAFLGRVSTEDQEERGTIQNQVEFCRKYSDLHQLGEPIFYLDDGVSGTIPLELRPAGKQLLDDAKAGKFNLLLIYRLDRLGRSARVVLNAVHELESYNIKIRSMTEPFDTADPSGRFLLTILAGVADLEHDTILERMWLGANRAARAGKWLGGIVPFGYIVVDKFLEINNNLLPGLDLSEADVIQMMYKLLVVKGYSCIKIADYFNALGIPTSYQKDGRLISKGKRKENTSGMWTPSRIRNMIVNPTYKGVHIYGRRSTKKRDLITRSVPAIVSEDIWDQAQICLRNNQLAALTNRTHEYLLTGIIKCGTCGLNYVGTAFNRNSSAGGVLLYYRCNGKNAYRGNLHGHCTSKNIPVGAIDNIVWGDCLNFIKNPRNLTAEVPKTLSHNNVTYNFESERNVLEKSFKNKDTEREMVIDLYRRKLISSVEVETQLSKINNEVLLIEEKLREIGDSEKETKKANDHIKSINTLLRETNMKIDGPIPFEMQKKIVRILTKEVIVHTIENDGKLSYDFTIRYKLPSP